MVLWELTVEELTGFLLSVAVLEAVELDGFLLSVEVLEIVELDGILLTVVLLETVELDGILLTVVVLEVAELGGMLLTDAVLAGMELSDFTELESLEVLKDPDGSESAVSEEETSDMISDKSCSGIDGIGGIGILSFFAQPVINNALASSKAASRILSFFILSAPDLLTSWPPDIRRRTARFKFGVN